MKKASIICALLLSFFCGSAQNKNDTGTVGISKKVPTRKYEASETPIYKNPLEAKPDAMHRNPAWNAGEKAKEDSMRSRDLEYPKQNYKMNPKKNCPGLS